MSDEKKNWIVRMECIVRKDVFLEDCTEAQAIDDPWGHAIEEDEIDMLDWEIISKEENK